jgi:formylglycine-generating enzyme required for sulfatase activity
MRKYLLLLLLVALGSSVLFGQNSARRGQDYAYFFYVTDFAPGWETLPETAGEVAEIAQELADNYGFTVRTYANYTRQQILDEITRINELNYGPNDQVLFFFSMHGQYDTASDEGFLIPRAGRLRDPYGETWIAYAELGRRIARNPARHILLALDACYSGAFGDRYRGRPEVDPRSQALDCREKVARAFQYRSRLYFTAGGRRQRTPARSLFAARWLAFLREGAAKGLLTKNELRYYLSTIETPRPEGGSFTSQHEPGGDFVFVHRAACGDATEDTNSEDAIHWRTVGTDRELAVEHLRLFPGCSHYDRALALVAAPSDRNPGGSPSATANREPKNPGAPYRLGELPYMVPIAGGTFLMGSNDGDENERPVHSVTLSDYRLGRYEVTVGEYLTFVQATGGNEPDWLEKGNKYHIDTGSKDYYKKYGYSRTALSLPIVGVSWYDAVAYCNWLSEQHGYSPAYRIEGETVTPIWANNGYRLPTEAEWEYAARDRGGNQIWAGTSAETSLPEYVNHDGSRDGFSSAAPVGKLRPNRLGLYDMSGNVREWCWDCYGDYTSDSVRDPKGPSRGSLHVIRGGDWVWGPEKCRTTNREFDFAGSANFHYGFRLARSQ